MRFLLSSIIKIRMYYIVFVLTLIPNMNCIVRTKTVFECVCVCVMYMFYAYFM